MGRTVLHKQNCFGTLFLRSIRIELNLTIVWAYGVQFQELS